MKDIFYLVILVFLTSCGTSFVAKHGQLSVKGTQLVDKNQQQIMLRGMSLGWHSMWPRFYNKSTVSWLKKDFKVNVVRAALGVEHGEFGNYMEDKNFAKQKVFDVIDGAIKNKIYVIVDWHSHNIKLNEAKEFFDEVSMKYGAYPNVIYEIFNEPDYETWADVKLYSEEIIKVIRKNDPDNIILIGSPSWDQDIHLPAKNPITIDKNIMYTMHFYAATHQKWLRDRTDEAIKSGLPIFVSESAGMEATGDGKMDYKSWQEYIDWMEQRGISWVVWSVSDKDETCSILKKSAKSDGHWKTEDLKESGIRTREYLRFYNSKEP